MGNNTRKDVDLRELMLMGMAVFALLVVLNVAYVFREQWLAQLPFESDALQRFRSVLASLLTSLR